MTINSKAEAAIPETQLKIKVLEQTATEGKAVYSITVHAGNISYFVDDIKKDLDKEYKEKNDDYWAELEDGVYELFSTAFEKEIEDHLWESIRHEGKYSGIGLNVLKRPGKEEDFKNAIWEFELELLFEIEPIHSKIEESLKNFFKNAP